MRKLPNLFLLFVFLLFVKFQAQAQAPGYMGKRFSVSYGLHLGPAFTKSTPNLGFYNSKHEFMLGFCLSEKWQMALTLERYSTIYNNTLYVEDLNTNPQNFYNIKGTNYSLLFKKFKKGYVAPWGPYFAFGPIYNAYKTNYNNYMYVTQRVQNHDTLISNFGPKEQDFSNVDFAMGWGQSRVFKDRVILDWGMMFHLRAMAGAFGGSFSDFFWSVSQEEYIRRTAALRINRLNAFNAYIKVGYLF